MKKLLLISSSLIMLSACFPEPVTPPAGDTAAPVATQTAWSASLEVGATETLTYTFDESVDSSGASFTDNAFCTASNLVNNGTTVTLDVAGAGEGECEVVLNGITDSSGNGGSSYTATTNVTAALPLKSCKAILTDNPASADGVYTIDPDGVGGVAAFDVRCDMTRQGGGWTLFLKTWYNQSPSIKGVTAAVGSVTDGLTLKGNSYKLADASVRDIIGNTNNFDILAEQTGYNTSYSTGNYEYVILENYTASWRFDGVVAGSSSTTTFKSYRKSDGALAHTFNLNCGEETNGGGIICQTVLSDSPEGGSGCTINMGTVSNSAWHHFTMQAFNTDSYLYICNGAQHSSSHNMNHIWWVRERN